MAGPFIPIPFHNLRSPLLRDWARREYPDGIPVDGIAAFFAALQQQLRADVTTDFLAWAAVHPEAAIDPVAHAWAVYRAAGFTDADEA
jgi:hypothetical protein